SLGATSLGYAHRSPFDVGPCDGATGSRGLDALKIDIELARECAHSRKHLRLLCGRPLRGDSSRGRMFAAAELADNCASVLLGPFGKFDEWHADLHDISLGAKHVRNASRPPCRSRRKRAADR